MYLLQVYAITTTSVFSNNRSGNTFSENHILQIVPISQK